MVKYFDEEWPKEEAILSLGLKMSRQSKAERQAKTMDRLYKALYRYPHCRYLWYCCWNNKSRSKI